MLHQRITENYIEAFLRRKVRPLNNVVGTACPPLSPVFNFSQIEPGSKRIGKWNIIRNGKWNITTGYASPNYSARLQNKYIVARAQSIYNTNHQTISVMPQFHNKKWLKEMQEKNLTTYNKLKSKK